MFAIGCIAVLTLSGCNGGNFQSPLSPAVDVTPTPPPPPAREETRLDVRLMRK
jgi:hypothetical protein